ncbi:ferric reductase [Ferviditalea candida]|uniref:Ferric reductase n=1 Tax=Ferviditalea candida TaxID=3108399 RepID=A0ABU5ZC22_9BACL|nr:ferric reductase [Paenibacillaceae bacterium T2]
MAEWITSLPLWGIIRVLGLISYLSLTLGVCLGIVYSFPIWKGKVKASMYKTHTFFTIAGTALGLLHGVFTVVDTYMPFSWREVLVPFAASHSPFLNGLGTLAGYGMLLLIFTSDIRNKLGKIVWRSIHLLSYPIWLMAFIHGYFLGTDSSLHDIGLMYFYSLVAIVLLTFIRFALPPGPKADPARRRADRSRRVINGRAAE